MGKSDNYVGAIKKRSHEPRYKDDKNEAERLIVIIMIYGRKREKYDIAASTRKKKKKQFESGQKVI